MNKHLSPEAVALKNRLECERKMSSHQMMSPLFDQTHKLLVDLIEGINIPSTDMPIKFKPVNTDAKKISHKE